MNSASTPRSAFKSLLRLFLQPIFYATLFLLLIESSYFLNPDSIWRRCAGFAWLFTAAVMVIVPWVFGLAPFFDRAFWQLPHRGWYLLAFFLPTALLLFGINGYHFNQFNCESPQEVSLALKALKTENSLGLFSLGYIGVYPMRGYLVTTWPTLLLGPGLITLRLGFGLFYLGAYVAFLAAVLRFLQGLKAPDAPLLAGYAGIVVSLAIYPLIFARTFEQTSLPLAMTLLFLAGLLFYLSRPTFIAQFWVIWTFGYLPYCYTPALATWGMALVILLYLVIWHRAFGLIPALIYGGCTIVLATWIQAGDILKWKFHIGDPEGAWGHYTAFDWFWRYCYGFQSFVGGDQSLVPAPLAIGLLAALYLSWRARDIRLPLILCWAILTVAAGISLKGWCWAPVGFDLHRAMVILPFLSLGVVLCLVRYAGNVFSNPQTHRIASFSLMLLMLLMAIKSTPVPFLKRTIDMSGENPTDIEEAIMTIFAVDWEHHPIKRIYVVPPMEQPIEWGLTYLSPETEIIRTAPPAGEKVPGTYVLSYRSLDPDAHGWSEDLPSFRRRPYLQLKEE